MSRACRAAALAVLLLPGSHAEVIDRVAVAFDRHVITESAIREQVRVTALLNEEPVAINAVSKRKAAEQLLEQALIRREMELSRYVLPDAGEIPALLEQFRKQHYRDRDKYRKVLADYGVTEEQLGRTLLQQAAIVRFVELRFRPGVAVSDAEVEKYYLEEFVPQWNKRGTGPVPDIEEARAEIEEVLAAERVDQALDAWLTDARNQARVRYFEEAFQ